jgi:hypothetical protein
MSDVVHGQDVKVEKEVGGVFYEIACGTDCSFGFTNTFIGKTTRTSGLFFKRRVRMSDCKGTVNGVTKNTNTGGLSIFHFLEEGIRRDEGFYKFTFEDEDGNIVIITMIALIEVINISGDVNDFSVFDLSIQQTGGVELTTVPPPPSIQPENWFSDFWTTGVGQFEINGASAIKGYQLFSQELLEVDREGTQYDIITSGTPGNREALYDSLGGRIVFANEFNPDERVFVLFKTLL